jgi:hypothetical protein
VTARLLEFRPKKGSPVALDAIERELLEALLDHAEKLVTEAVPAMEYGKRECDCCQQDETVFCDYETMTRDGSKAETYECCEFCFEAECTPKGPCKRFRGPTL